MSILFNGTNNYINCGSPSLLDNIFENGATIMAWIYPIGWGGGGLGRIISKTSGSPTFGNGWSFHLSETDGSFGNAESFIFSHTTNSSFGSWTAPDNTLSLNSWHHVAASFNKDSNNNTPLLYRNGVALSVEEKNSPKGPFSDDSSNSMLLGGTVDGSRTFNGIQEDLRIYNRILTVSEIQLIYHSIGVDSILQDLVARWPFVGLGPGTAATSSISDLSGNSLHGTPVNSPFFQQGIIRTNKVRYF